MKLAVFVDVESAFLEAVCDSMIEHLRTLDRDRCQLFAWSSQGSDVARSRAAEAGVERLFSGFLPKPHVLVDADEPQLWPGLTVQHPARVEAASESSYREAAFAAYRPIEIPDCVTAIRTRPGMYVGDTENARHMVHWALRDRLGHIEEGAGGRAVSVRMLPGDVIEFIDDQRRYPVSVEALHEACTQLEAQFELPILNALSRSFEAEVWADGLWVRAEYERGALARGPFESKGPLGNGTRLRFSPDPEIFGCTHIDPAWIAARMEELSVLDAGVSLTLQTEEETHRFFARDGLGDWVRAHAGKNASTRRGVVRAGDERCEVAWTWTQTAPTLVRGWVNSVHTKAGGSHVEALQGLLTEGAPSPEHRLVAAVHVNMPHPRYKAPIKDELDNPQVARLVRLAVEAALFDPSPAR